MSAIDDQIRDGIDRLFDRISRMSDEQLLLLRAAWDEADETERRQAWQTVKSTIHAASRQKLLDEATTRFATWGTREDMIGYWGVANLPSHGSGMARASVRSAALPAVMDGIAATIAGDGLDDHEREVLLAPLSSVAGEQR